MAAKYSAAHWRYLSTLGGNPDNARRVMFRQATENGQTRSEIVDGLDWRPLRDDEYFVTRSSDMPQVDNGWVR